MPLISLFTSNFKPIGNSFREMGPDAPLNDFEYVILPNNDLTYIFIPDNDLFNTFIADNDIQYILLPDNDIDNTVIPSNNVIYTIIPNGDGTYTLVPNNDITYSLLQPSPSPTPSVTPTITPTMSVTPTSTITPTMTPTPTSSAPVPGQFIYVAQAGILWNSYGANYLSFGRSQDGTNRTPLAGWYFIDSNNVVRQLLNTPLWFGGGSLSPTQNGNGWMAVANGPFSISASATTITFYETMPVILSATPTPSITSTITPTPSVTSTITPTPTSTSTPTQTVTPTPSISATLTPTPSVTPTTSPIPSSNFTMTIEESGSDVVWTGSGTIDITSLTNRGTTSTTAGFNGTLGIWGMGSLSPTAINKYDVVFNSSSGSYGTSFGTPNSSSGDFVGILPGTATDRSIQVPNGYVSGTYLSNTSTFTNKTITSLGLTPGTYTYSWGSGANASSITIIIAVSTATPTPTPTVTKTPTQTPTVTKTPTVTPTNSVTPTMSMTPTPSVTTGGLTTSNLILHYDPSNSSSYPGTGTTITDLSGNGRNGTMSNISYTSPYFTYNGSSSQISIADDALLEPGSGDWTIEIWVNQSVAGNDVVLGKFPAGGATVSYSIRTTNTTYYAQLGSGIGSGSTLFQNSTNHVGTIGTWYQLVYVFTNVAANTLQTFVNGTSIGSVSHSLASILNTSTNLYIGSYNNGEYAQWFDGKIGITRLYNKALTSSEVLNNYNADKSKYGL